MRVLNFFALVGIFSTCSYSRAGDFHQIAFQGSNYVVIGAFAVRENAENFTAHAKESRFNARFEMNPMRNLYYVYVLNTDDRTQAISEARRLRVETEYADAWVYGGSLGESQLGQDISPVTETPIAEITATDTETPVAVNEPVTKPAEENDDEDINGKKFLFNLYRASNGEKVQGDVNVIDTDRARKMATYKGNEPVRVHPPGNNSGKISLVCEVFGYRKIQHDLDYADPTSEEGITTDDNTNIVVVPFELARLRKGDIAVMYNVYFFKDAGVMRPESRYEVNSLLDMLRENPKYTIRIHGHTNGGAPGKIISLGENKDFFSLTGTKEGFGSAKKLSAERAEVIREYLIAEGIDPKRMETKAWGGKRPIHDKLSSRAQENVRVEIEILKD